MKEELKYWNKKLKSEIKEEDLSFEKEKMLNHINFYQHERLVHLLITLAFTIYLLFSLVMSLIYPSIPMFLLFIILLIMVAFYIRYYYILENGVQQLYKLYDKLIEKKKKS